MKYIKQEKEEFKKSVIVQVKEYQKYLQDTLVFTIAKIKEESIKCSYCEHQKQVLESKPTLSKQFSPKFEKTIPKMTSNSQSYTSLKKTLKTVEQRYQILKQENQFYSKHIENIISK